MKRKLFRMISMILCLAVTLSATPAFAAETVATYSLDGTAIAQAESEVAPVFGELPSAGDSITYTLEVDHTVFPEFVLYGFACGLTGDSTIIVYDESNTAVGGVELRNSLSGLNSIYCPKGFTRISNSSGDVITYTIVASTTTGGAAYAFNLGTIDDFVSLYGGTNFATVAKNVPSDEVAELGITGHFKGSQALLNTGEWFHYTADGYTYITAGITNHNSLAFVVYDGDTMEEVYATSAADRVIETHSSTLYEGHVQKGLDLEAGKDYLIMFYSTSAINPDELTDYYNIYIGLPCTSTYELDLRSTSTYSVPAYSTETFSFNVTGLPDSAMLGTTTKVAFSTSSLADNAYISSCIITAPNGYSFPALNGSESGFDEPDVLNYFTNPNNVPLNGTWTVSIRTTKALSGLSFKISGYARVIVGNDGN